MGSIHKSFKQLIEELQYAFFEERINFHDYKQACELVTFKEEGKYRS